MLALRIAPKAEKDLRRIGPGTPLSRIERKLDDVEEALHVAGPDEAPSTKRLHGTDWPTWRTRVGDYRILWVFDNEGPIVVRVVHRSDLDQVIAQL